MIESFADRDTATDFRDESVRVYAAIERVARRKLLLLDAALPGWMICACRRAIGSRRCAAIGRAIQHRINDQWRICFRWDNGAHDVEIVDYH